MEVVYYSTEPRDLSTSFQRTLVSIVPGARTSRYYTVNALKSALLSATGNQTLAVFDIDKEEDFLDLYFISHLFCKLSTIIILPDYAEHTVALGRRMKPDFLLSRDTNRAEFSSLIQQLIRKPRAVVSINHCRTLTASPNLCFAPGTERRVSNF